MATAMDVANFFIGLYRRSDEPMTMLRAMKLTYYAQGHALACLGEPLFDEDVEAWKHGPVIPSIYKALNQFKKDRIKKTVGKYSDDLFSADQKQLLIDIGAQYGQYTTTALVSKSHAPHGPWYDVYNPDGKHIKIPKELMREHFTNDEKLKRFDMEEFIRNLRPAGVKGPDGSTMLPRDYDDY